MWRIFKTIMLMINIYQAKANMRRKFFFDIIARHLDTEIRKMLVRDFMIIAIPRTMLVHNLRPIGV